MEWVYAHYCYFAGCDSLCDWVCDNGNHETDSGRETIFVEGDYENEKGVYF